MVVRTNVVTDGTARKDFIDGVLALKAECHATGHDRLTGLSTYDAFVLWHYELMMTAPAGQRNLAHGGPSFLPWHRYMLLVLEAHLQRILGKPQFGIPYWNWAADGDLSKAQQPTSALWNDVDGIGGSGSPIATGPFAEGQFGVVIAANGSGTLEVQAPPRGLARNFGGRVAALPPSADLRAVMQTPVYDAAPWDRTVTSFRNHLEGWRPTFPGLHNDVHGWVGLDMARATSPNDPVFFLHHANVDRIWAAWQQKHPGAPYLPNPGEPGMAGHRLDDNLVTMCGEPMTAADLLEVSMLYRYDTLDDILNA